MMGTLFLALMLLNALQPLLATAEREECAKVCEAIDAEYEGEDVLSTRCAQAIRARGRDERIL